MPQHRDQDFNWHQQVGARPLRLRPRNRYISSLLGYVLSLLVGLGALKLLLRLLGFGLRHHFIAVDSTLTVLLVWSQMVLIPLGMGLIAAYFWIDAREAEREINDRPLDAHGSVLLNTLLLAGGTLFISADLAGFLALGTPVVCFLMWIGTRLGPRVWQNNPFLKW